MERHIKCYFFRSGDNDGFWVQHTRHKEGDADFVRYSDCYFYGGRGNEIKKVVDHVHGVTYIPSPDCPYFQE